MTIEEKLDHFGTLCFNDARERSDKMLGDYTASLKKILEEHKVDAKRQAEMQVAAEAETIKREINKALSIEQINIKRQFSIRQDELKLKLMDELKDRLASFRKTDAYEALLVRQITQALEFAAGAPVTIYLDPGDGDRLEQLSRLTGTELTLSSYPFLGGTRAVISSRNILIDNSFETKLEETQANFQFRLGGR